MKQGIPKEEFSCLNDSVHMIESFRGCSHPQFDYEKGFLMKKLILIILCTLLLTGCAASGISATSDQTEAPSQTAHATVTLAVYSSNDNADGLVRSEVQAEQINETVIVEQLIGKGVLSENTAVNSLTQNEKQLTIDFNTGFQTCLFSLGTAGESLLIQSVVNTFLEAYGAESVVLTVNGATLESGHAVYDFPLTFTK